MNPITAWHEEHAYFGRLLQLLQEEVDTLYEGGTPNYELMLDILSYLREYGDQVHHPREDETFRRLLRYCPEQRKTLDRLRQEHRVIAQAGGKLRELLEEAAADMLVARADIEAAAATYIAFYTGHIAREEAEVLPAAGQVLTEADWTAAKAAAPSSVNPLISDHPDHRFSRLRRRIASEAA